MAANNGYSNFPAPQSSSYAVAPPLGHIPPPPPTRPPPYPQFSSLPQSLAGNYSQDYQQQVHTDSAGITDTYTEETNRFETRVSKETQGEQRSTSHDTTRDVVTTNEDRGTEGAGPQLESDTTNQGDRYKSNEHLKMKFSEGFQNKKRPSSSIAVQLKPQNSALKKPKTDSIKLSVAQAFGSDDDDDDNPVEEMPRSAKLRMRNIGKDTPTSAGPNSFNKSSKGFTDQAAVFKKQFGI